MRSLIQSSFMCEVSGNQTNTILILVFIISFFLFKMIGNKSTTNSSTEDPLMKFRRAEEYFRKHQSDNEEFFNTSE
jgi:hypothetical protein